jgi:hypothetical protein
MDLVLLTDVNDDFMNVENVRRMIGQGKMGEDVVMGVLLSLGLWGGIDVDVGNGQIKVDCKEFLLWLKCINNRVIDQEACGFLKQKLRVDVEPDKRNVTFQIPADLLDNPRLKEAREKAAWINFSRRSEAEAKRNKRQELKRRREELEEESAPAARRTRWDSDEEFAVENVPDYYEDCVSFICLFYSTFYAIVIMSANILLMSA